MSRTLPASLLVHAMALTALWLLAVPRLLDTPAVPAIAVDIVSEADYRQLTHTPIPKVAPTRPEQMATPAPNPLPPEPVPDPEPVAAATPDMIAATQLLASDIIADPANRQVRDTLTLLDPSERITQLCNIEGIEQLRLLHPNAQPDSMDPSAMTPAVVRGLTLEAKGGAYRLDHKWYQIALTCTVAPDFLSVTAFAFLPGDAIPRDQWDSQNLIDEDVELD